MIKAQLNVQWWNMCKLHDFSNNMIVVPQGRVQKTKYENFFQKKDVYWSISCSLLEAMGSFLATEIAHWPKWNSHLSYVTCTF